MIIGAGPTGLAAATLLAQRGIRTVLVERHHQPYPLPRAVHVDDEVFRILQQLGIAEQFAQISRPASGLRLLDARHRVIAEFRRSQLTGSQGHPPSNLFDQPDLERLLRQNLSRYQAAELHTGVEAVGLEVPQTTSPITVHLQATGTNLETLRPTATTTTIRASVVLGCDGAGSTVRQWIGTSLEDLGFEERWLVVDLRSSVPLQVWDGVEQVCDPRRAATFMWITGERYRWEFRLHPGETAAMLTEPEILHALMAPWLGPIAQEKLTVDRAAEYTFRARLADRWRSDRVFLLGDAAHLTPPFIGQGLGSGLRDAANLTWKLAQVLTGTADESLLETYQAERKPHARALIRLAVTAGWAMTGGQDRAAALRRTLLSIGCRIPGVSSQVLDNTSPRLHPGPLVTKLPLGRRLAHPTRRDLAGTLCPQPWVIANGVRCRLDDVLGLSSVVLVDSNDDPIDAEVVALADHSRALMISLSSATTAIATKTDQDVVTIDAPQLRRWLARHRVRAVLIRPDRIVQTSVPRVGRYGG